MSAADFALKVEADYQALKLRRAGTSFPATANRASEAGHPCARYLSLQRLASEKKPPIDAALAMRFDEGRLQERAVLADLAEMGYDVERAQRALSWREFELVGHPDFTVGRDGERYTADAKSLTGRLFDVLRVPQDFTAHTWHVVRGWPAQIQLYLLMEASHEEGLLILKNKEAGSLRVVPFRLDYDYLDPILRRLEVVNAAVRSQELPPPIADAEICPRCPYYGPCYGGELRFGPTLAVLGEEEAAALLPLLERWWALRPSAKEYDELDEERKDALGRLAVGEYLVGPFVVKAREYRRRAYSVAEALCRRFDVVRLP